MENKIVAPHENPDETRMKMAKNNLLFDVLKKELPKYTEACVEASKGMHEGVRQIYINGMSDALVNWAEFARYKMQFMASAQQLVQELAKWEKQFIEWQTSIHGEQTIKAALAEANERAKNG